MSNLFQMKLVSRKTGLSPHVIRVWERRYQAVTPMRSSTNRRFYSAEDVERLTLLRHATEAGYRIGQIARMPAAELKQLIMDSGPPAIRAERFSDEEPLSDTFVDALIRSVQEYDAETLRKGLERAAVSLSRPHLIEKILVPLIQRVGDLWNEGSLRVAQEHLASSVVRSFVGNLNGTTDLPPNAPCVVITTPVSQVHEMGALIAAARALSIGWRVIYLGPNLPAEEICTAAERNQARAVALSIVYPPHDAHLREELIKLRSLLPLTIALIVGGRAAASYEDVLEQINAKIAHKINDMPLLLDSLSASPPS